MPYYIGSVTNIYSFSSLVSTPPGEGSPPSFGSGGSPPSHQHPSSPPLTDDSAYSPTGGDRATTILHVEQSEDGAVKRITRTTRTVSASSETGVEARVYRRSVVRSSTSTSSSIDEDEPPLFRSELHRLSSRGSSMSSFDIPIETSENASMESGYFDSEKRRVSEDEKAKVEKILQGDDGNIEGKMRYNSALVHHISRQPSEISEHSITLSAPRGGSSQEHVPGGQEDEPFSAETNESCFKSDIASTDSSVTTTKRRQPLVSTENLNQELLLENRPKINLTNTKIRSSSVSSIVSDVFSPSEEKQLNIKQLADLPESDTKVVFIRSVSTDHTEETIERTAIRPVIKIPSTRTSTATTSSLRRSANVFRQEENGESIPREPPKKAKFDATEPSDPAKQHTEIDYKRTYKAQNEDELLPLKRRKEYEIAPGIDSQQDTDTDYNTERTSTEGEDIVGSLQSDSIYVTQHPLDATDASQLVESLTDTIRTEIEFDEKYMEDQPSMHRASAADLVESGEAVPLAQADITMSPRPSGPPKFFRQLSIENEITGEVTVHTPESETYSDADITDILDSPTKDFRSLSVYDNVDYSTISITSGAVDDDDSAILGQTYEARSVRSTVPSLSTLAYMQARNSIDISEVEQSLEACLAKVVSEQNDSDDNYTAVVDNDNLARQEENNSQTCQDNYDTKSAMVTSLQDHTEEIHRPISGDSTIGIDAYYEFADALSDEIIGSTINSLSTFSTCMESTIDSDTRVTSLDDICEDSTLSDPNIAPTKHSDTADLTSEEVHEEIIEKISSNRSQLPVRQTPLSSTPSSRKMPSSPETTNRPPRSTPKLDSLEEVDEETITPTNASTKSRPKLSRLPRISSGHSSDKEPEKQSSIEAIPKIPRMAQRDKRVDFGDSHSSDNSLLNESFTEEIRSVGSDQLEGEEQELILNDLASLSIDGEDEMGMNLQAELQAGRRSPSFVEKVRHYLFRHASVDTEIRSPEDKTKTLHEAPDLYHAVSDPTQMIQRYNDPEISVHPKRHMLFASKSIPAIVIHEPEDSPPPPSNSSSSGSASLSNDSDSDEDVNVVDVKGERPPAKHKLHKHLSLDSYQYNIEHSNATTLTLQEHNQATKRESKIPRYRSLDSDRLMRTENIGPSSSSTDDHFDDEIQAFIQLDLQSDEESCEIQQELKLGNRQPGFLDRVKQYFLAKEADSDSDANKNVKECEIDSTEIQLDITGHPPNVEILKDGDPFSQSSNSSFERTGLECCDSELYNWQWETMQANIEHSAEGYTNKGGIVYDEKLFSGIETVLPSPSRLTDKEVSSKQRDEKVDNESEEQEQNLQLKTRNSSDDDKNDNKDILDDEFEDENLDDLYQYVECLKIDSDDEDGQFLVSEFKSGNRTPAFLSDIGHYFANHKDVSGETDIGLIDKVTTPTSPETTTSNDNVQANMTLHGNSTNHKPMPNVEYNYSANRPLANLEDGVNDPLKGSLMANMEDMTDNDLILALTDSKEDNIEGSTARQRLIDEIRSGNKSPSIFERIRAFLGTRPTSTAEQASIAVVYNEPHVTEQGISAEKEEDCGSTDQNVSDFERKTNSASGGFDSASDENEDVPLDMIKDMTNQELIITLDNHNIADDDLEGFHLKLEIEEGNRSPSLFARIRSYLIKALAQTSPSADQYTHVNNGKGALIIDDIGMSGTYQQFPTNTDTPDMLKKDLVILLNTLDNNDEDKQRLIDEVKSGNRSPGVFDRIRALFAGSSTAADESRINEPTMSESPEDITLTNVNKFGDIEDGIKTTDVDSSTLTDKSDNDPNKPIYLNKEQGLMIKEPHKQVGNEPTAMSTPDSIHHMSNQDLLIAMDKCEDDAAELKLEIAEGERSPGLFARIRSYLSNKLAETSYTDQLSQHNEALGYNVRVDHGVGSQGKQNFDKENLEEMSESDLLSLLNTRIKNNSSDTLDNEKHQLKDEIKSGNRSTSLFARMRAFLASSPSVKESISSRESTKPEDIEEQVLAPTNILPVSNKGSGQTDIEPTYPRGRAYSEEDSKVDSMTVKIDHIDDGTQSNEPISHRVADMTDQELVLTLGACELAEGDGEGKALKLEIEEGKQSPGLLERIRTYLRQKLPNEASMEDGTAVNDRGTIDDGHMGVHDRQISTTVNIEEMSEIDLLNLLNTNNQNNNGETRDSVKQELVDDIESGNRSKDLFDRIRAFLVPSIEGSCLDFDDRNLEQAKDGLRYSIPEQSSHNPQISTNMSKFQAAPAGSGSYKQDHEFINSSSDIDNLSNDEILELLHQVSDDDSILVAQAFLYQVSQGDTSPSLYEQIRAFLKDKCELQKFKIRLSDDNDHDAQIIDNTDNRSMIEQDHTVLLFREKCKSSETLDSEAKELLDELNSKKPRIGILDRIRNYLLSGPRVHPGVLAAMSSLETKSSLDQEDSDSDISLDVQVNVKRESLQSSDNKQDTRGKSPTLFQKILNFFSQSDSNKKEKSPEIVNEKIIATAQSPSDKKGTSDSNANLSTTDHNDPSMASRDGLQRNADCNSPVHFSESCEMRKPPRVESGTETLNEEIFQTRSDALTAPNIGDEYQDYNGENKYWFSYLEY